MSHSSTARDPPGVGIVEQAIVEPVVVVEQCHFTRSGQAAPEPVEHRRHLGGRALRFLATPRGLPAPHPAGELAFEITLGAPQIAEPDFGRRDQVEVGERVDEGKADAAVELRPCGEFGRDVVADHKAAPPFLDDEHRADDAFVLAQEKAGAAPGL